MPSVLEVNRSIANLSNPSYEGHVCADHVCRAFQMSALSILGQSMLMPVIAFLAYSTVTLMWGGLGSPRLNKKKSGASADDLRQQRRRPLSPHVVWQ